jgi:hypothetical protein
MSYYSCTSHGTHARTDQRWLVGCRDCLVLRYSASTDFFRPKHVYAPGDPIEPGVTQFVMDPRTSTVTIESTGEQFVLDSANDFIGHWLSSGRAELMWHPRHQAPNILIRDVGYGVTGSGTTMVGQFTSDLTGILIAKAMTDPHPYPVNPGLAAGYLTAWPWVCGCGAKAPEGQTVCLACRQSSAAT